MTHFSAVPTPACPGTRRRPHPVSNAPRYRHCALRDGVSGGFVSSTVILCMGTEEVLEMARPKTLGSRLKSAARRATKRALVSALAACSSSSSPRERRGGSTTGSTLELIRWLRRDVSTQLGCSILATLTAVATPMRSDDHASERGRGRGVRRVARIAGQPGGAQPPAPFCVSPARASRAGRAWARRKISGSPLLTSLDHAVSETRGAAGIVMLSRLSPMFPFAACSFAFGACRVSASDFLAGTLAGLAPGTA